MADQAETHPHEESLRRLQAIENEARRRMRAAGEQAEEIITQAEREAGGIVGGTRAAAKRQADRIIEEAESEVEQQAQALHDDAESEVAEMRRKAGENMESSVTFLVSWITGT